MKEQQPLLFDLAEGRRLGLIGMEKAAEPQSVQIWIAQATEYYDLQPVGWRFSGDDIVGHCGLVREVKMNDNNYVGKWFSNMHFKGRIKDIGSIRSKRVSNHGKKIGYWEKVY
jgi:hypothetical protein